MLLKNFGNSFNAQRDARQTRMFPPDKRSATSIEQFLSEFELRRPRALPRAAYATAAWRRLAAGAGVLIWCGVSMWMLLRRPVTARHSTSVPSVATQESPQYPLTPLTALTRIPLPEPP